MDHFPANSQQKSVYMYYFQNKSEYFLGVSKHRETNESTRPYAECFYYWEVFGYPDETRALVLEITSQMQQYEIMQ